MVIPKYWNQNGIGSLPDYFPAWRKVVWARERDYMAYREWVVVLGTHFQAHAHIESIMTRTQIVPSHIVSPVATVLDIVTPEGKCNIREQSSLH